ncbi:rhodanese-like domain-containing protein [Psychromonas sp.]|uniref:rhodanese-like domain-containing protein n=1 Tax=Psychromonas sp. TaxID=1884585 RepID=UPI0039E63B82
MNGRALVESLRSQVQELDVAQLKAIMQQNPQAIVIDIREVAETDAGSIADTLLIPRGILEMQINTHKRITERFSNVELLAEQPIYLLCRSGARSVLSAFSLQMMGFKDVYSVAGGFLAWQAAGYDCAN